MNSCKFYYESGKINETREFINDKENGIDKFYLENGIQAKETIFENGIKTKEYEFDESGNKIIPAIDKLELSAYETGFYEYKDFNSYELLYQPIVIMKWKNISNESIKEQIEIEAIFINNTKKEELGKTSSYFQGYSDAPLQIGLSRQSYLKCDVGFTHAYGIYNADISCQIIINKILYKTVKIKNDILTSNRIQ